MLKDVRTVVSDGSNLTYINVSGNHGMATGGSGDVLTGVICGLLAGGFRQWKPHVWACTAMGLPETRQRRGPAVMVSWREIFWAVCRK